MYKIYHPEAGLLLIELGRRIDDYFYHGNFYQIVLWENNEPNALAVALKHHYDAAGGDAYWGFEFNLARFLERLTKPFNENDQAIAVIAEAQYTLGRYYQTCPGLSKQQREEALLFYQLAAKNRHGKAMLALAYCYHKGLFEPANLEQAAFWESEYNKLEGFENENVYLIAQNLSSLQELEKIGFLNLKLELAYCYLHGLVVAQDLRKAFDRCQEVIQSLGQKQAAGKTLNATEMMAQEAALELLSCYSLQGVDQCVKASFWKATALKVMSTTYQWNNNLTPHRIPDYPLTHSEELELEAYKTEKVIPTLRKRINALKYAEIDGENFHEGQSEEDQVELLGRLAARCCAGHPLQFRKDHADKRREAYGQLLQVIKTHIDANYCRLVQPPDQYLQAERRWKELPERWHCYPKIDRKGWIFYVQTSGLNLVYEGLKAKHLNLSTRDLAFVMQVGAHSFSLGNSFLRGLRSGQLRLACSLLEVHYQRKLNEFCLEHHSKVTEDYPELQFPHPGTKFFGRWPSEEMEHTLQPEIRFFGRWPCTETIQFIVSDILRKRISMLTQADILNTPSESSKRYGFPTTEFEKICALDYDPYAASWVMEPPAENDEPDWAAYWFQRQHLLLTHFLKVSLYIHDTWLHKMAIGDGPYSPDFQLAIDYVSDLVKRFPDYKDLFERLLNRLKRREVEAILRPEMLYPALGWSKYWKQSLLTLNPFETIERLDCAPFKDGLFCSD